MRDFKVYVFDLDGVLWRGSDAVVHAPEALERLRNRADKPALFFLTNNSSQTRETYADKLNRLGMPCSTNEIVTSASATADYIIHTLDGAGKTALAVGGPGILRELDLVGVSVTHTSEPADESTFGVEKFDFVVVGLDREFNYRTLWRAQQAIMGGAKFIATNRDGQYPVEEGKVTPGGGSMVAALEACTEVTPVTVGKPETPGLQTILDRTGVAPEDLLMVGDRPDTDILCGNRLGVPTLLVMTGVTTEEKAQALYAQDPHMRPRWTVPDLRSL